MAKGRTGADDAGPATFPALWRFADMALNDIEIDTLRCLLRGQQPLLAPSDLVRLEMLGLVRDAGRSGLILSAAGRQAAVSASLSRVFR